MSRLTSTTTVAVAAAAVAAATAQPIATRHPQSARGPAVPRAAISAFAIDRRAPLPVAVPSSAAKFFTSPVAFLLGAAHADQFPSPPPVLGSVVFAGRSNVGKSSLLNALWHSHKLARVSATPGRTQQLNFFAPTVSPPAHIVDFPGYGFAAHSSKQHAQSWQTLVGDFLRARVNNIKCVYLLLDSRRGLTEIDHAFMQFLCEQGIAFQVVLTKIDKVSTRDFNLLRHTFQLFFGGRLALNECIELHRLVEKGGVHATHAVKQVDRLVAALDAEPSDAPLLGAVAQRVFATCMPWVHVTSTSTGFGVPELRASVATHLGIRKNI